MERPIEARLLLYVMTVAEEGNITRAARTRLFIAPGSLARDIRNLERRIGYPLFVRRWDGVILTPSGEVFVEEARKSLDHSRRAADRGAAASRGETGVLHVGFTPFLDTFRIVELQERFAKEMPEMDLRFQSAYCSVQVERILREVLEAGLITLPLAVEELAIRCIWQTRLVLAIPEGSPLATGGFVEFRELVNQPSIWLARDVNTGLYDRLLRTFRDRGYAPSIVREALTYDEMLDAISSGLGFGFVKETTAQRLRMQGVVFRELKDARLTVHIGIVHRTDKSSRGLDTLVRVLLSLSDWEGASPAQIHSG